MMTHPNRGHERPDQERPRRHRHRGVQARDEGTSRDQRSEHRDADRAAGTDEGYRGLRETFGLEV